MLRDMRFFAIVVAAIFIGACVPRDYPYYYMSLHAPGIKVVSTGRPTLNGVSDAKEMPTQYKLDRDGYTLTFDVEQNSYWPSIKMAAFSLQGEPYILELDTDNRCSTVSSDTHLNTVMLTWNPPFKRGCNDKEPQLEEQYFVLLVRNEKEVIVGKESIRFSLVRNGTYTESDAL